MSLYACDMAKVIIKEKYRPDFESFSRHRSWKPAVTPEMTAIMNYINEYGEYKIYETSEKNYKFDYNAETGVLFFYAFYNVYNPESRCLYYDVFDYIIPFAAEKYLDCGCWREDMGMDDIDIDEMYERGASDGPPFADEKDLERCRQEAEKVTRLAETDIDELLRQLETPY